jgi:hypothetical protein
MLNHESCWNGRSLMALPRPFVRSHPPLIWGRLNRGQTDLSFAVDPERAAMPDPSSQDAGRFRDASPGRRAIRRLSALRLVSWVMAGALPRADHQVRRLTRGRHTLTSVLSGLTVAQLTTTGARSGRPQMVLLLVSLPSAGLS